MSSLLTKLKSNSLIDLKTDLFLSILGCISCFPIALTSGSLEGRFEVSHLLMFNPLVTLLKYVLKRYAICSFLETTFSFSTKIVVFRGMSPNIPGNIPKHSEGCRQTFRGFSPNIPGSVAKHYRECPQIFWECLCYSKNFGEKIWK